MYTGRLWFDRLRERVSEARESAEYALPGLTEPGLDEIDRDLAEAELLLVEHETAARFIAGGDAPRDLAASFDMPFDQVFIEFDQPVKLAEERGEGLRGILTSRTDGRYRVRAWFEERRFSVTPRYDFELIPGEPMDGPEGRIADVLYWLSGYVSSPNVLAIRHNRRSELVKRHQAAGRPATSNFYTFSAVPEERKRRPRRKLGEPKPRTTEVHGHFRRAHWHTLPSRMSRAWFPTTWVRSHKRRIHEQKAEPEVRMAA